MMVNGRGKVYMLDRENSVFSVHNLQFPHRKNHDQHLSNTLLDGEFVMDVDPNTNQKIPRFLIYDIIKFEVNFFKYFSYYFENYHLDNIKTKNFYLII